MIIVGVVSRIRCMTLRLPHKFMHDFMYSPCFERLNGDMSLRLPHDSLDFPSNGMCKWCGLPLVYGPLGCKRWHRHGTGLDLS